MLHFKYVQFDNFLITSGNLKTSHLLYYAGYLGTLEKLCKKKNLKTTPWVEFCNTEGAR